MSLVCLLLAMGLSGLNLFPTENEPLVAISGPLIAPEETPCPISNCGMLWEGDECRQCALANVESYRTRERTAAEQSVGYARYWAAARKCGRQYSRTSRQSQAEAVERARESLIWFAGCRE